MTVSSVRQFFREWFVVIFLVIMTYWLYNAYQIGQRQIQASQQIIAAKERLFQEREAIVQTREKVGNIEQRLQLNDVPDRLKRIETSITAAVAQNQDSIDKLDANQKALVDKTMKMVSSLSSILEVPKEVIDGTHPLKAEPVIPPDRVKVEPGKIP